MTNLESEIQSGTKFLRNFDGEKIQEFVKNIKPPILIAAMGSSYYMPSGRLRSITRIVNLNEKIDSMMAVGEFDLMESFLERSKSRYEILEKYELE